MTVYCRWCKNLLMTWTPTAVMAPFLMDRPVVELIRVFADAGHGDDMRFVGGCTRNILMNLPMSDIDVATVLRPERVKEIFEAAGYNVHPTGIEHGTVTVAIKGEPYEITTLRRDVETDGRRAVIEFSTDWAEDAQRRDFRCNAIYMDAKGNLFDPVGGGIRDAMERKLVFVGNAEDRIREDYLRILRLFRFQATLGATAAQDALDACSTWREGMSTLSGERIEKEMMKLMGSKNPVPSVQSLIDTGVYFSIFATSPDMTRFRRVVSATESAEVRLAALFEDDTDAHRTMIAWKSSNELSRRVRGASSGPVSMERGDLKAEAYNIGFDTLRDRMVLTWAEECDPDMSVTDLHDLIGEVATDIPVFPIKGQDIVDAGVAPGPNIGRVLKDVEAWWKSSGYPDRDRCVSRIAESV